MKKKTILITGGTGTFGQEFVQHLLSKKQFKKIIIFSRDEQKHYLMNLRFKNNPLLRFFIGDIRDISRLEIATRDVDCIVHAAAMKHVPIAEYNPIECIKTNIYGMENLINVSLKNNISKVLCLSTDKAVNPINLYGATKLSADKLAIAANNLSGGLKTSFSVVRYGNIIGSKGSIIPYFRELIGQGLKELPITDERMTRFWLTILDGVKFVNFALDNMQGGEIFFPKIPSLKIKDLISAIKSDVKLKKIGIRPGEKIHEVLCDKDMSRYTIEFKNFFLIKPTIILKEKKDYYKINGEKGVDVKENFAYDSETNTDFLDIKGIRKLISS